MSFLSDRTWHCWMLVLAYILCSVLLLANAKGDLLAKVLLEQRVARRLPNSCLCLLSQPSSLAGHA